MLDRLGNIVHFTGEQPTHDQMQMVMEDFFSAGGKIRWEKDRWFIDLPGTASPALRRIPGSAVFERELVDCGRWIEVWPGGNTLYIMTRQQDEFTNSLAQGLAQLFKRFWKAELEE